jgi:hypothetical protein
VIEGNTDSNGEISDERFYSLDQPLTGHARKSSGTPNYIQGPISFTLDKDTGDTITVQLVLGE